MQVCSWVLARVQLDACTRATGCLYACSVISSFHPIPLDSFDVDNVRVVELRDGKTLVGPVSKEQTSAVKDHLLTTGELLKIDQPRIDESQLAAQPA